MGCITRLENGLTNNESQEELVEGMKKQQGLATFEIEELPPTNATASKQQAIVITTDVDVQRLPRMSLQQGGRLRSLR
jgi:hypothetical protein